MVQCIIAGPAGVRTGRFATIRASLEPASPGEQTGNPEGAFRLPRIRGAARLQAMRLRGARGAGGARHRAGLDDETGREIRAAAAGGAAAALPADPAEHDPRPL